MSLRQPPPQDLRSSWTGRRVAVTGADTFLGRRVVRLLRANYADVVAIVSPGIDRSWLARLGVRCRAMDLVRHDDGSALAECLRGREVLLHLATTVDFGADWNSLVQRNVKATRTVFASAIEADVPRIVHGSSAVALGLSATPTPSKEEAVHVPLLAQTAPQVATLAQAERTALDYQANGTAEVVVVNPGFLIGPVEGEGSPFVRYCVRCWEGREPLYFAGGANFVDVRDAARGVLLAAEHGAPGERYLLGGRNRTWRAFHEDLGHVAGRDLFRIGLPTAAAGPLMAARRWFGPRATTADVASAETLGPGMARFAGAFLFLDSTKAKERLAYRNRPLRDSLSDTYASLRSARQFAA